MKIETYLPIFPGFSGTWFECDKEELMIEEGRSYEDYSWNYAKYYQDAAAEIVNIIGAWLEDEAQIKVKHQKLISPRYYNYENDSINIECTLSEDSMNNIMIYLVNNQPQFERYLKERYTSYDGFISRYSSNFTDWMNYLGNNEKMHHVFGSVLNFILLELGYTSETLYEEFCEKDIFLDCELLNEQNYGKVRKI